MTFVMGVAVLNQTLQSRLGGMAFSSLFRALNPFASNDYPRDKNYKFMPWREIGGLLLFAVAYWLTTQLGLLFSVQPEKVASIWPVSGLALAVLLLNPKRRWGKLLLVIFFSNAIGNLSGGNPLLPSLGFALANLLEPLCGAWLIIYISKSKITFERARELLALLMAAIFPNAFTAFIGAGVSSFSFGAPFERAWLVWWVADGLGMLLIAPVIVYWARRDHARMHITFYRILEAVVFIFALTVFAVLLFGPTTRADAPILRNYMLFPLLIWLAFRFPPREMANTLLLFSSIAIWNTLQGYGIFSFPNQTNTDHLLGLQIYLSVAVFSGLLLSAMVAERQQAASALRAIIDVSPVPMALNDDYQNITFLNPAFIQTFGYTLEDIPKLTDWWTKAYPDPEYRQWASNTWKIALNQAKKTGIPFSPIEFNVQCKNETFKTVLVNASMFSNSIDGNHLVVLYDITDRKKSEEALYASEQNFRSLAENSLDAILIAAVDGRTLYANRRVSEILQYSQDELLSLKQKDLAVPSVYPELKQRLEDRIAGKYVPNQYETLIRRKDGSVFSAEISGSRTPWQGETCDLVFFRDITERKQAESALRESEEKYRRLFDTANLAIFQSTPQGGVISVNPAFARMFGYDSPEEACRMIKNVNTDVFMDPNRRSEIIRLMKENPDIRVFENLYRRKDGSSFVGKADTLPIYDEEGRMLRIEGIIEDVTERRRMEETLRASEEKYRFVANFTYDWESWRDPHGRYIYISPACERITGYKVEEFIENPDLMSKITYPNDRDMVVRHFHTIVEKNRDKFSQLDFRIITRGGDLRWINHRCTAVYGEDGAWLGRRESNRDITERKHAEDILRSRLWLSQFADTHSSDDLLQSALNEAEALTNSEIGFFHFLDDDQKTLSLQMWSTNTLNNLCTAEGKGQHYSVDEAGVWVDCITKREPIIYNDYASLTHRKGLPDGHAPIHRILVVPIFRGDLIVAIFGIGNKKTDYDEDDVRTVAQLAEFIWDIVQRKKSEEEVMRVKNELEIANQQLASALEREKELSHTDALTGISNRRYLFECAQSAFDLAVRHAHPLSVLMFDIDHFKGFNDTYGHDIGDLILQRVVQVAGEELRSADIIGRYGGEEFVVLFPITTAQQAAVVAERIRAGVESLRIPTHKDQASTTISIGIAELSQIGSGIQSVDDLIRCADEAMYQSKQAGRNRITIFSRDSSL